MFLIQAGDKPLCCHNNCRAKTIVFPALCPVVQVCNLRRSRINSQGTFGSHGIASPHARPPETTPHVPYSGGGQAPALQPVSNF